MNTSSARTSGGNTYANQVGADSPVPPVVTSPRRRRRTAAALAASLLMATAASVGSQAPAAATPQQLCAVLEVPERSTQVWIAKLAPYERFNVKDIGGSIWAGVWFTGWNGPQGWNGYAPIGFPLANARPYSLIMKIEGDGIGWRYIGANSTTFYNNSPFHRNLYARVNDNAPGNGDGAFAMSHCWYR